jgi:hypothetical protein
MKPLILLYILFSLGACGQQKESVKTWQSRFRDIKFQYTSPWTLVPALDIKDQTLVGVIDMKDGKSYIIRCFDDLSKEKLNDNDYLAGIKKTMLEPNPKNKLLSEDSIYFHNQISFRQVFLMYTEKWGLLKQISYLLRNGKDAITIQISFPTTEIDVSTQITPDVLTQFDKLVKLNGF